MIFGRPSKKWIPLNRRELVETSIISMEEVENANIRYLIKIVRGVECPMLDLKKESELSDEEKLELKNFHPAFLK